MAKKLRHCWISISTMPNAFNFGNRMIEKCLRDLLKLDSEEIAIDAYKSIQKDDIERINSCDFVVIPGCTLLQRYEHPAMEQIHLLLPPKYCFGGAFFTRLIFPHPKYCQTIARPIGVRDPFTHSYLKIYGIESRLIGCPTMFCGSANGWKNDRTGPVVFNFGRKSIDAQIRLLREVKTFSEVRIVIQQEDQRDALSEWPEFSNDFIEYSSVDRVIETFANASVVVTGRLHGALPAIVSGTPVVFIQLVHDSRISLLKHIGVKIRNPYSKRLLPLVKDLKSGRVTYSKNIFYNINKLKLNFLEFVEEFRTKVYSASNY